ncbi:MAG TPA: GtrA family protein [Pseudobacteroides sp.]|uniref:GtrA family protein n=1 Tax=Pseudobacteroides sp. TaxID=1968840 RepID=UPI002F91DEB3
MLNNFNKRMLEEFRRLVSFSIIGVINTLITMGVDNGLFYFLKVDQNISLTLGYFVGMINSYILNSIFTFKSKSDYKKSKDKMLKFLVINIISYLAALAAKDFGAILFSTQSKNYINSAFGVIAAQIVNYLGYKVWVFRDKVKGKN